VAAKAAPGKTGRVPDAIPTPSRVIQAAPAAVPAAAAAVAKGEHPDPRHGIEIGPSVAVRDIDTGTRHQAQIVVVELRMNRSAECPRGRHRAPDGTRAGA